MSDRWIKWICAGLIFVLLVVIPVIVFGQSGFRPDDVKVDTVAGGPPGVWNARRLILQEGANIALYRDGDTVMIVATAGSGGAAVWDSLHKHLDTIEVLYAKIDTTTAKIPTASLADSTSGGAARSETSKLADSSKTVTHEIISDVAGGAFTGNTETGITATYQDGDNTVDLVVSIPVWDSLHAQLDTIQCLWKKLDTAAVIRDAIHDTIVAHWTAFTAGDNLGNHTATQDLNLTAYGIDTDSTMAVDLGSGPEPEIYFNRYNNAGDTGTSLAFYAPAFQFMMKPKWFGIDMDFDSVRFVPNNLYSIGHSGMVILNGATAIHGDDWVGIKCAPGQAGNWVLTLPKWDGTTGMCLVDSSANGTLRWAYPAYSDSAGATTHQSIERWDNDTTAMPFVFSSAYKGTWATADSEFATIETIEDSMALAGRKAGQVWTGVHDFGGATSIEIVNGANPTTDADGEIAYDSDDEALEVYDGAVSRTIPTVKIFEATIMDPDGVVDDTVIIADIDALRYPGGIKVLAYGISTRQSSTYSVMFLEMTDPLTLGATCDTVATSTSTEASSTGAGIYDGDIAAGSYVAVFLPATNIDQIHVKVVYYVKDFN